MIYFFFGYQITSLAWTCLFLWVVFLLFNFHLITVCTSKALCLLLRHVCDFWHKNFVYNWKYTSSHVATYESRWCLARHKKIFCTCFESLSSYTSAAIYIRRSCFFPEIVTKYLLHTNAWFPVTYVTMSGSWKGMPRHCFVFTFLFIFVPVIKMSVIISLLILCLLFKS